MLVPLISLLLLAYSQNTVTEAEAKKICAHAIECGTTLGPKTCQDMLAGLELTPDCIWFLIKARCHVLPDVKMCFLRCRRPGHGRCLDTTRVEECVEPYWLRIKDCEVYCRYLGAREGSCGRWGECVCQ